MEKATFAAGCFWGVEAAFRSIEAVHETRVGYTGGTLEDPSYENVCCGTTGHAEAVEVGYDPWKVSYDDLLAAFWGAHDPTRLGDAQYRSAIFPHTVEQHVAAIASRKRMQATLGPDRPVTTEIAPASRFWPAEERHQRYLEQSPG